MSTRRVAAALLAAGLGLAGLAVPASAAVPVAHPPAARDYADVCAAPKPHVAACLTLVRTNVAQRTQASLAGAAPTGVGYGPADLQNAYLLPSGQGSGQTVAIVDAYDDPSAETDLNTYRADWGLPPCTTANGCFSKVNENGQASPLPAASGSSGWATEESLDIDMVSAICPDCHILLVEADTANVSDLGTGVNSAASLGAKFISNSYGADEYPQETADSSAYYDHPGLVVTASAGDSGYGAQFPAASPSVVAVGGTSLKTASNSRGWDETVWSGTGSGCSADEPKPSWQTDSGCANRTIGDVSAVADPSTGVAIYDSYDQNGWLEVGGTSVSSPIIASIYALVGPPAAGTYPASYLYANSSHLNDVTDGSNGSCGVSYLCDGGPGYDGPTGLGTPDGIGAFGKPASNIVTVANPGSQTGTADVPFSLQVRATDSGSGQTLAYGADGLPAGLSISSSTGLISGTPTSLGDSTVAITVTDGSGASGSVKVGFSVVSPVTVADPGPQGAYVGQPVSIQVPATDAVPGRRITRYSASGLPGGLTVNASTGTVTGTVTTAGYHLTTFTATDAAGRTGSVRVIWFDGLAQASGRAGPVHLNGGGQCLTASSGLNGAAVVLRPCDRAQRWTVAADGTVRVLGKCLRAEGGSARLWSCGQGAQRQWRIASRGELVNPASGHCLAAPSAKPASGALVSVRPCTGSGAQRWAAAGGPLVSGVTGLCADGGARMWYCGNTSAQAWLIRPDGTIRLGRACLTVGASTANGTKVRLTACGSGNAAQQWRTGANGTLANPHSGKCLADPGSSPIAGSPLVIERCAAIPGEIWHVE